MGAIEQPTAHHKKAHASKQASQNIGANITCHAIGMPCAETMSGTLGYVPCIPGCSGCSRGAPWSSWVLLGASSVPPGHLLGASWVSLASILSDIRCHDASSSCCHHLGQIKIFRPICLYNLAWGLTMGSCPYCLTLHSPHEAYRI